jgi:hypothetical protein
VRNLPSGWSTEASDSPFQSCYSQSFFFKFANWYCNEWRYGEKNQSRFSKYMHSEKPVNDAVSCVWMNEIVR